MTSAGSSPELALESFTVDSDPCSFGLTVSYLRSVTFGISCRRSFDENRILGKRNIVEKKARWKKICALDPALKGEVCRALISLRPVLPLSAATLVAPGIQI